MMTPPKVFGVGFMKTGTTSLGRALEVLGYRVKGPFGLTDPTIAETGLETALQLATEYDAVQDNPWCILYRELDQHFPGSKFILTLRPVDQWLESVTRHFGYRTSPLRAWVFGEGRPKGNEALYARRYADHTAAVRHYFQDRPEDLLILRLTEGDGWAQLCPFLNVPIPPVDFPWANDTTTRRRLRIRRYLRNPVASLTTLYRSYIGGY